MDNPYQLKAEYLTPAGLGYLAEFNAQRRALKPLECIVAFWRNEISAWDPRINYFTYYDKKGRFRATRLHRLLMFLKYKLPIFFGDKVHQVRYLIKYGKPPTSGYVYSIHGLYKRLESFGRRIL